ncbi:hypothetical protein HQ496_00690 [bacterium]|nr:hypothetical protein [bacterium]
MNSRIGSFDNVIRSEYELMANAVVLEQMELLDLGTDYEDLENWDGDELDRSFTVGDMSIAFTLIVEVQFVDEDGQPSEVETNQKEVTIRATQEKFLVPLVQHSRLFSD